MAYCTVLDLAPDEGKSSYEPRAAHSRTANKRSRKHIAQLSIVQWWACVGRNGGGGGVVQAGASLPVRRRRYKNGWVQGVSRLVCFKLRASEAGIDVKVCYAPI